MIKRIFLVLLAILFNSFIFAAEKPFFLRGIRTLGMGGPYTAVANDQNAFFYNPAGVTSRKNYLFTLAEIRVGVSEDFLEFVQWLDDNQDDLENFDSDDSNKLTKERKAELRRDISNEISTYKNTLSISAPNFNYISGPLGIDGTTFWGLGIFDNVEASFKMEEAGLLVPELEVKGNADLAGIFLLSHKFDKISAGLNVKYLARVSFLEKKSVLLLDEIDDPILQPGKGWGVDVGLNYDLADNLKIGMMVSDIGATKIDYGKVDDDDLTDNYDDSRSARSDLIYPRVNFGVAYKPLKEWFNVLFVPDVSLALDFRDITDEDGDGEIEDVAEFLKKTHMGAEFTWKFLSGRIGLNSGYPTAGIGFYLWALKFDYAYYTDEKGMYPGDSPESFHMASVSLRFGETVKKDRL
ncbi:MAG: hypothetical protein GY817_01940 [bacterium]|nr:hypothetical protein [bacterium]